MAFQFIQKLALPHNLQMNLQDHSIILPFKIGLIRKTHRTQVIITQIPDHPAHPNTLETTFLPH